MKNCGTKHHLTCILKIQSVSQHLISLDLTKEAEERQVAEGTHQGLWQQAGNGQPSILKVIWSIGIGKGSESFESIPICLISTRKHIMYA